MLAAQRAAELQHQVGHLLGDAAHAGHVVGVLEVEQRPDVQTADAGVAVEGAVGAVLVQDVAESGRKLRQPFRRDRRVLDKSDRLAVAGHTEQAAASRRGAGSTAARAWPASRAGTMPVTPLTPCSLCRSFSTRSATSRLVVAAELDHEQRRRPALDGLHRVPQRQVAGRQFDEHVVHQLDGRRPEFQARRQGVQCRGQAGELRHEQAAAFRPGHDVQLRLRDDGQRAFAADDELVKAD